jgi:thioredoxin-like negative regulator of GroEL
MRASVGRFLHCLVAAIVSLPAFHVLAFLVFAATLQAQDKSAEYTSEMQKAEAAMSGRQFPDALASFKRASSLDKTSAEAHLGMARAHHAMGVFNKASDNCKNAVKYSGENQELLARVQNQCGLSIFGLSQKPNDKYVREAEAAFRAALAADGTLLISQFNLGVALLRQGRDEEGLAELSAFVEAVPKAPEAAEARRFIDNPRRARENFAPAFSITTLDEQRLTLEDLKGKVVLLDFWATWCGPCRQATPGLKGLHAKYKDRPFVIVGVSLDYQPAPWQRYIQDNGMEWPQYYDRNRAVMKLFGVKPIPTYVLIDHEGIVRATREGWSPSIDGWLDGQVNKYLKAIPE